MINGCLNLFDNSYDFLFHPINSGKPHNSKLWRTITSVAIGVLTLGSVHAVIGTIQGLSWLAPRVNRYLKDCLPKAAAKINDIVIKKFKSQPKHVDRDLLTRFPVSKREVEGKDPVQYVLDIMKGNFENVEKAYPGISVSDPDKEAIKSDFLTFWDGQFCNIYGYAQNLKPAQALDLYLKMFELLPKDKSFDSLKSRLCGTIRDRIAGLEELPNWGRPPTSDLEDASLIPKLSKKLDAKWLEWCKQGYPNHKEFFLPEEIAIINDNNCQISKFYINREMGVYQKAKEFLASPEMMEWARSGISYADQVIQEIIENDRRQSAIGHLRRCDIPSFEKRKQQYDLKLLANKLDCLIDKLKRQLEDS